MEEMPPQELNIYLNELFYYNNIRTKDIKEYEPILLLSLMASFESYLKKKNYRFSLSLIAVLTTNKPVNKLCHFSLSGATIYIYGG